MTYNQCGFCNYQVSESEKYCPNCGFKNPWKIKRKWELIRYNEEQINTIRTEGKIIKGLSLGVAGLFTVSSALCLFSFATGGFSLLSLISGVFAFLSAFGASGFFIYYWTAFELKNKRKKRYLINEEKMIFRRIKEIGQKKDKIQNVQKRIQRSEGKKDLVRTLSILSESHDHLKQYEKRFYTELKKIQLIRWRNTFRPIISEWHKPGYEQGEQYLDKLETIIEQGKKLLLSWSQNHDAVTGNDEKTLIDQIKSDLDVLFHLQKSLLNRQAQLSIQDIRPLETEQLYRKQAITFQSYIKKSTEYINAHSFMKAFEELEDEYIRFQSEKDVLGE